jgi:hypothetical protein|nr:MAG TPA_asm: hypothetical protein [Caudoviricetes sp.]
MKFIVDHITSIMTVFTIGSIVALGAVAKKLYDLDY